MNSDIHTKSLANYLFGALIPGFSIYPSYMLANFITAVSKVLEQKYSLYIYLETPIILRKDKVSCQMCTMMIYIELYVCIHHVYFCGSM